MTEPQIIRSPSGEAMVVLPIAEYEALLAAAQGGDEDAVEIALYDIRKRELAEKAVQPLPPEVSLAMLKGQTRLAALRRWRGLSQKTLSERAKLGQGYLSDLESGRRSGAVATLARLSAALDVPEEWLA